MAASSATIVTRYRAVRSLLIRVAQLCVRRNVERPDNHFAGERTPAVGTDRVPVRFAKWCAWATNGRFRRQARNQSRCRLLSRAHGGGQGLLSAVPVSGTNSITWKIVNPFPGTRNEFDCVPDPPSIKRYCPATTCLNRTRPFGLVGMPPTDGTVST